MGAFDEAIAQAKSGTPDTVPHSATGLFDDAIRAAKKTEEPTTSVGEAMGRGAASGLSFNTDDDLAGLRAAAGTKPTAGGVSSIAQTLLGLAKYWGGDPAAAKSYDEKVKAYRARSELAAKEHPVAYTGSQIGSSFLIPVGGEAAGLGLGMRALRSAGIGAGFGAASGFGEGEDIQDRLRHAAIGGGIGGVVGGVFSPLANLAMTGAQSAYRKTFGAMNPENSALRQVATANARDVRSDPAAANRLTEAEMAATPEATVLDLGGQATRGLARTATNISPEASAALNRTVNDRFGGQSQRVSDWFNQNFHYPDPEATQAALDQIEKTVNNKAYAKAFSAGDRPIMTDDMQHMVDHAPALIDAIKGAIPSVKNRAVGMGMGARDPGIRFEAGVPVFDRGPPNLQFWDTVKRQLDSMASQGFRKGDTDASSYGALAQKLRNELDSQVPEYAPARQGAARFFGAENASDAGKQFFGNQMTAEQGRQALARFSPLEKQLFQDSFAREYLDKVGGISDRTNILNQISNSNNAREKLNVALGPQKANELEIKLRGERIMDRARGAITGNSSTVAQLAAAGALGAGAGYGLDDVQGATAGGLMSAILAAGAKHGNAQLNQQVMQRVGDMLTSRDPAVIQRGQQLIARSEKLMNVFRHADTLVAKAAGSEGGGAGKVTELPPITVE